MLRKSLQLVFIFGSSSYCFASDPLLSMPHMMIKMVSSLCLVIGIILVVSLFYRAWNKQGIGSVGKKSIRILERHFVDSKKSLYLVQIENQKWFMVSDQRGLHAINSISNLSQSPNLAFENSLKVDNCHD